MRSIRGFVCKHNFPLINKTMGKLDKYISVSVEEYSFVEWEDVYNEFVKDKDNVLVKPGYSNPKTFE